MSVVDEWFNYAHGVTVFGFVRRRIRPVQVVHHGPAEYADKSHVGQDYFQTIAKTLGDLFLEPQRLRVTSDQKHVSDFLVFVHYVVDLLNT